VAADLTKLGRTSHTTIEGFTQCLLEDLNHSTSTTDTQAVTFEFSASWEASIQHSSSSTSTSVNATNGPSCQQYHLPLGWQPYQ